MSRSGHSDGESHCEQQPDHGYLSDWRMADDIGTAVVLSVADYTDRRPTDLPVLSTSIDPDALQQLLDGPRDSVSVCFSYADCEVSLIGDGELRLRSQ